MTYLPVCDIFFPLCEALRSSPQVLVHAPTGAGKSTLLPLLLLKKDLFSGRIIMLEPRRIAARSVAHRLAQQLDEKVGETIGFRMRGHTCVGKNTRLEVVTEGILVQMLQNDPELSDVSLVILDEFHERSLQADLALALLLDMQSALREDLRILLMSATLDGGNLAQLLPNAPLISSKGRSFPVDCFYHPINPHLSFVQEVCSAVLRLIQSQTGSMLVFLPGRAEILALADLLTNKVDRQTLICPLYGSLSLDEQQAAIDPAPDGSRKIVLATNIAETSLTIEGICLVIDSCQEKVAYFDVRSGLTRLQRQRISQASMIQRAGRAGRLSAGICWHLCSKEQAERSAAHSEPEILHSDLSALLLTVLQWGCAQVNELQWIDNPPVASISAANNLLQQIGALNERGGLNQLGQQMSQFGSSPRLAALMCAAQSISSETKNNNALYWAARLCAILEEPPKQGDCDLSSCLQHFSAKWVKRSEQLLKMINFKGIKPNTDVDLSLITTLLLVAYPDRVAKQRDKHGLYQLANGLGAAIDENVRLAGQSWLIAPLVMQNEHHANARIQLACVLDIESAMNNMPHLFTEQTQLEWNEKSGTLQTYKRKQYGRLAVKTTLLSSPSADDIKAALLDWVAQRGLDALTWSDDSNQTHLRLQLANQWFPEKALPAVDPQTLIEQLSQWLQPLLINIRDLKQLAKIDLSAGLLNRLTWQQQQWLENALPRDYIVPTGSRIALTYHPDKLPVLSVRMQEMYGVNETPKIAEGRISLVVELLSPAMRPLQVTQDLAAFWAGSYREVQKEMKGRYPKHLWPDSPATALPTRRVKKYSQ